MFKVLVLQTQNNLSDERTEFYLRDRLTWMRFLGLGLGKSVRTPTRSGPSVKRLRRPEQSSGCLICSTGSSALPAT